MERTRTSCGSLAAISNLTYGTVAGDAYCQPNIGFGVRFLDLLSPAQQALSFAVDALSGKSLPLWLLQQGSRTARCSFRLLVPSGLELSVKVDKRPPLSERFNSWDELVARASQHREGLEAGGWVLVP